MSEDTSFLPSLPEAGLAQQVRTDLSRYLAPFLSRLYRTLDVRLVRTAHQCVAALLCLRTRSMALCLTEPGTLLLGGAHAPAGVKRVARRLANRAWSAADVEQWLLEQADQLVAQEEDVALVAFDQSVQEKAESLAAQGLCPVRSSKARGLARPRPGFGAGPAPHYHTGHSLAGGARDELEWLGALGRLPLVESAPAVDRGVAATPTGR